MDFEIHPHFDIAWQELLLRVSLNLDLDQSAREPGALWPVEQGIAIAGIWWFCDR
jgi:hypothetical protein